MSPSPPPPAPPNTSDTSLGSRLRRRWAAWFERWGGIAPLLVAEFVVWLGFGGLLPVLPLYFTEQGIDLATLGIVIAAWPAARLVSEPIFGWLADRTERVPLMVIGLVVTGVFGALPLVLTSPVAFVLLRAGSCSARRSGRSGRRSSVASPSCSCSAPSHRSSLRSVSL